METKEKMGKVIKVLVLLSVASILVLNVNAVGAREKFPNRPIAIICPFNPGGSTEKIVFLRKDLFLKRLRQGDLPGTQKTG